jgi:hypothetical protein
MTPVFGRLQQDEHRQLRSKQKKSDKDHANTAEHSQ